MKAIAGWLYTYRFPILSALLMVTSYIPFPPWALAFCFVPLWVFFYENKSNLKRLFIGGWITQFLFGLIGFHWVAITVRNFGGFPWPVTILILALFCSVAHLHYPLSSLLWGAINRKLQPSPQQQAWLLPLCFAICESFFPTIFFWHYGYAWLWSEFPVIHLAEWTGFYGLGLLILVINLCFFKFYISRKKKFILAGLGLIIIPNLLGYVRKTTYQEGGETLNAVIVQANIGNSIKLQQEHGAYHDQIILERHKKLTREGLDKNPQTDLVIWAETAYSDIVHKKFKRNLQLQFEDFVRQSETNFLIGAYQKKDRKTHNTLVAFNADGEMLDSYSKTYLLAFGEYFPGGNIFPPLKRWFPMVSDFGRGNGPKVLALNELQIGTQICYEALYSEFSAQLLKQGAQVMINVTNDSWFGTTFEPYQHLYINLARALEFRTPVLRSTNTGISTAISSNGKIHQFSPMREEWAGAFTVKYRKEPRATFYSYYAGCWKWILLALLALIIGGTVVRTRKS